MLKALEEQKTTEQWKKLQGFVLFKKKFENEKTENYRPLFLCSSTKVYEKLLLPLSRNSKKRKTDYTGSF
jgi:hypothetical protein